MGTLVCNLPSLYKVHVADHSVAGALGVIKKIKQCSLLVHGARVNVWMSLKEKFQFYLKTLKTILWHRFPAPHKIQIAKNT